MIPLCLRTARSNGHSDNFLLFFSNPSGSLIPRVNNNNNNNMSQSWPLSQEANKSSGVCSVCLATRQLYRLHLRGGPCIDMAPAMPPVQAPIHYHSPLPLNEANLVSYLTSLPSVPRLTKLLQVVLVHPRSYQTGVFGRPQTML